MDDCITKPFTIKTLIRCFEDHLPDRFSAEPGPEVEHDFIENGAPAADTGAISGSDDTAETRGITEKETIADAADHDPLDVPTIDPSTLDAIGGIGADDAAELIERIFGLYEVHAPDALSHLEQMNEAGDGEKIADAAHALKSLSFSIGATRVANACGTLEAEARNSNEQTFDQNISIIRDELQRAMLEIANLKAAA